VHRDPYHNLFCQSTLFALSSPTSIPASTFAPTLWDRNQADEVGRAVVGEKHVRVFPPNAADDLYISTDPLQRNTSLITTSAPDLKRFPRYEQALQDSWEATVGPGDVLFLPKGLFHSVRSLSKSVSVNEWFL
jgi:hypothetical protein